MDVARETERNKRIELRGDNGGEGGVGAGGEVRRTGRIERKE